ncbi:MAG: CHAT domain-containing protein [Microbacterium sp.]|uniref:CHAT domain-containing protein n=1 Tax=Microbacterium sp. TaxID=51671 RepID=UPI001AC426FA|nr:CHAT domain-containing protein [Microbacterium sp.]MBN9155098.1 CHAT domain-containing protein [Microbacterium sp.]
MARSADELHRDAVELVNRGRFSEARRLLQAAERRANDPDVAGRVAGTLAYLTARSGAVAEATRICQAALDTPGLGGHTRAILAGQMGALAEQSGQFDDAERWLALGIAGLQDDPPALANLLVNRSLVNMRRGDLAAAAQDAEAARTIFERIGSPVDEAQARHNEGYIALLEGDLVSAMRMMSAAQRELSGISAVMGAIGDVDRAEVLRDAGLTTEAERILEAAAAVFGSSRIPQARAEAEFHLARSLLMHDPPRAGRVAAAAARRFRTLGNETWAARANGIRLRAALSGGSVRQGGGRLDDPRRPPRAEEVDEAASALDGLGLRNEAAALRMSHALWRARRGITAGAPIRVPSSASIEVRLLAHEARAARATAAGRHADARRHAAAGLDTLAHWQDAFGSLDLQTSIAMHGSGLVLEGLGSAVRSGRPDVVFDWSEQARHLTQQVVPLRPPPDPDLAADLAELRMMRADDSEWMSDPRAVAIRERARERQWTQTGRARLQERVSLDDLQDTLDEQTALVAYVYTGDSLTALVVTHARADLVPLHDAPEARRALPGLRADLDMSASVRTGPMRQVVQRSLDSRLATLSSALLDEPARVAGTRRLVVTAPGVLSGIPWAMLPGMRGRVFTLAPSATRWAAVRESPRTSPVARVGFAVGPRVARGSEEVSVAASAWADARILPADDATVDAVTDIAAHVDVLHVAAHGRHAVDNPLFSGIELADGALFGYDIDRMPRVPETVVLSACEVGRSSVRWGEEAIGMTRIWLHAGVRDVVATPVIVADDVACELLGAMHEGLAAGEPPAEALAAASLRTGLVAPFQTHGSGF